MFTGVAKQRVFLKAKRAPLAGDPLGGQSRWVDHFSTMILGESLWADLLFLVDGGLVSAQLPPEFRFTSIRLVAARKRARSECTAPFQGPSKENPMVKW